MNKTSNNHAMKNVCEKLQTLTNLFVCYTMYQHFVNLLTNSQPFT